MSGGRAELGLGAGWYDGEHTAYGVPFPPLGERFERLEEQFAIITGLWDTPVGETFDFDGAALSIGGQPGPAQAGAAAAPAAHRGRGRRQAHAAPRRHLCRRVQPPLLVARRHRGAVRPGARRLHRPGRDPGTLRLSAAQAVCCGANDAEVERRAANIGRKAEDLRAHGLAGTPDEVVAGLQAFAAIGAESVYLQVLDLNDLEHIDLLAEDVLPRVA